MPMPELFSGSIRLAEGLIYPVCRLVIIAAGALYLIGNDRVGLWDRDEPRYAQTSKQMLLSEPADWVVPRLLDKVRTAKPIFIYWCLELSA